MPKKSPIETKKLNMNIPSSLLERVDRYAENIGLNRSSAIVVLIDNSLKEVEKMQITQEANLNMQRFMGNPELLGQIINQKK